MKCLIIAAGKGSRLTKTGQSKPLIKILGVPLIERVIRSVKSTGVTEFFVVLGYKSKLIQSFLQSLSIKLDININMVQNNDWEKENGLSVLKAQEYLQEPFILLMTDHLFDAAIVFDLLSLPVSADQLFLAVDENINNSLIDLEDATKVKIKSGKVQNIGKNIKNYNAIDTGIFLCLPFIFDALHKSQRVNNDFTLSGAIRLLAKEGKVFAHNINGRFWIDIDTEKDLEKAEQELLKQLRDKPNDGPVSRFLNRPLSIKISRQLVIRKITPNQISIFSFFLSIIAAGIFTLKGYIPLLVGGILAQFASVIDGCDGEVARLKYLKSDYGSWLDAVLDRYADAFLLFGLMWHAFAVNNNPLILLFGFLAIIGSFVLSYTADKYDNLMRQRISRNKSFRLGRDVRVFFVMLAALTNQIYSALIFIAVIMNLEAIRRIIVCRNNEKY